MIATNAGRVKKSQSMMTTKEDKENCSNNILLQGNQGQNKLAKLRESFSQCNNQQPEKIISCLKIQSKEQSEDHHLILKKEYSWLAKRDYSAEILDTLIRRSQDITEALKSHLITPHLRAKMVDWMIQVLSSYKMSEECFFRSVKYMDIFFKKTTRKLQVSDLHLIGVASMFMGSKYEEIYPFKLNTMYDKICRKKFAKREIIDMEQDLLLVLQFELQQTTCYDIIRHILAQLHICLEPKAAEYLNKVSIYLGKMAMHCADLAWKGDSLLAAAVIYIGLKTVEQVESSLESDNFLPEIIELAKINKCELLQISQQLLSLAKSFHKNYPNFSNLKKFNNAEYVQ